ncbi:MAG: hypothetical protein KatS3mg057_1846 [Herpetosiphonaceae bacterium]|nr:MAG: hypothetical protein KatS3mg057_1846 [Herpetosiphonaceae bacterium]
MKPRPGIRPVLFLILFTMLSSCSSGAPVADEPARSPSPPPSATATIVETAAAVPPTTTPVPPTVSPVASVELPTATATVRPPVIAGYIGYIVEEGKTLEEIARLAGSDPGLIWRYNRLAGEPQPGRELILPVLEGRRPAIESQPLIVNKGNTRNPWVALTLDAGAGSAPTPRILAALRERGVRITFFLTGTWIRENPELVRQIVADGHEIANHSYHHPAFPALTDAEIEEELRLTEEALHEVVGPDVSIRPYFRPPYGDYDRRVLERLVALGYLPIYWTFDSQDSIGDVKTPQYLLERVTGALPPEEMAGAIILAHCGSQPTAEALPAILDRFAAMGFEVRTLSDVLGP